MKDNVVAIPSYIEDIYKDYKADWNNSRTGAPTLNSS